MKIILTGSTGWVGGNVLNTCLADDSITSIVALIRREPAISHPKLQVILHDDFTHYPETLLSQLKGAQACIYCLGTNMPLRPASLNRKVNLEYAVATARAFSEGLEKPFRFVYLSGALVEKDPNRPLYFLPETRHMRGDLERELLKLEVEQREKGSEVVIVRPGFVVPEKAPVLTWTMSMAGSVIRIDQLARAMLEVAVHGSEKVTLESEELVALAEKAGVKA